MARDDVCAGAPVVMDRAVEEAVERDPLLADPLGLLEQQPTARGPALSVAAAICLVGLLTVVALAGIRSRERAGIRDDLQARVSSSLSLLEVWGTEHERTAASWAGVPEVAESVVELLAADDVLASPAQARLRARLAPVLELHGYLGFFAVAPDGTSLASARDANTGTPNLVALDDPERFALVLDGDTVLTIPQVTDVPIPDGSGDLATVLTMFAGAPIEVDGEVIAVLLFRIDVPNEFAGLFRSERRGRTGDLLAFDESGTLLVEPRSASDLATVRDHDGAFWEFTLTEPGTGGQLTTMAASATAERSASDVEGYRNHLGEHVYGAWAWSDAFGFGVAAEAASDELLVQWRSVRNVVLSLSAGIALLLGALGWYLGWARPANHRSREVAVERARRLRTLLDQSSEGICVVARDHRILMVNRSMADLFGIDPARIGDLEVSDLVGSRRRRSHRTLVDGFFESGSPGGLMAPSSRNVEAMRVDGSTFPTEVTLSRIDIDGEEVILATVRDLSTDLRAIELDQSLRELERLTAVAAHDLKEPLRKVGSLCNMLASSPAPDPTVQRLQASADRAKSLVDDLATYIEWSTQDLDVEPVDLGLVVADVLASFEATIETVGAEVEVADLPVVVGDRRLLRKLFVELIENALTFRSATPRLLIGSRPSEQNDMAQITLQDNGIGIPDGEGARALEAFRTFGRNVVGAEGGTTGNGIGLAICRRVVERHRGAIALTNTGHGLLVAVDLPTALDDPAPTGSTGGSLERMMG